MFTSKPSGSSLGMRAVAVVVLLLAAWVALQILKGVLIAVFWSVAAVLVLVAVIWAVHALRSD
jgi:hypothetical protein